MQLAIAGYVCPNTWSEQHIADLAQPMPDCGGDLDPEQPGLCKAHAQYGKQSLDKPASPPVAPFSAGILLLEVQPLATPAPYSSIPVPDLSRAAAPPLAIAHCCFRI